jgi:hypothetical protein
MSRFSTSQHSSNRLRSLVRFFTPEPVFRDLLAMPFYSSWRIVASLKLLVAVQDAWGSSVVSAGFLVLPWVEDH